MTHVAFCNTCVLFIKVPIHKLFCFNVKQEAQSKESDFKLKPLKTHPKSIQNSEEQILKLVALNLRFYKGCKFITFPFFLTTIFKICYLLILRCKKLLKILTAGWFQ